MKKQIETIQEELGKKIANCSSLKKLEAVEQEFFGRKNGKITVLSKQLKDLSAAQKKEIGMLLNSLRNEVNTNISQKRAELEEKKWEHIDTDEAIDITQPQLPKKRVGHIHPISQAKKRLTDVAKSMGFKVEDGPELESDYYTFQALNIPEHHPARDGQDTFYIKDHPTWCMRAHVSNMQVRMLKKYGAPLRIVYPGRVFRNEAVDATHEHTFSQFEGLMVGKEVSISNLIGLLKEFVSGYYGEEKEIRLRPGYFPFVEPGFELDIQYNTSTGPEWLEMLGCGLVHPSVLKEAGLDPEQYQGLAFGVGIERLVMIKYGIQDIRHFYAGDVRFLTQF